MISPYYFLKRYIGVNDFKGTFFMPVSNQELLEAEALLGFSFPSQLREFYQTIGAGILSCGEKYPEMLGDSITNEILEPKVVANFAKGILEWEGQERWMAESTYEMLEEGDLPFFEIGDSTNFMVMKAKSDNPNAVWTDSGIKIENSFEKFIWRLYYESPWFYDDIIEEHYKKLEGKKGE